MKNFSEINRALVAKKKIFTFIAAALLSVTALQAATITQEIDITGFGPWDGATYNTETKTLNPGKAWNGGSQWFGEGENAYDASGYIQIVLELAEASTQPVAFSISYADGTADQKTVLAAGVTSGTIDLTGKLIKSFAVQLNSNTFDDVTIVLSRVYLVGTNVKKHSLVTLNSTPTKVENWDTGLGGGDLSIAHAGDQVIINLTHVDGGEYSSQLQFKSNDEYLESFPANVELADDVDQIRFTLTCADAAKVRVHGAWITGYYISVTSVQLQRYAVLTDTTVTLADWNGGVDVPHANLPTLKAGDVLCLDVTAATEGGQIYLQHGWANFTATYNHVFTADDVAALPKTFKFELTQALINDLGSDGLTIQGENYTCVKSYIEEGEEGPTTAIDQATGEQKATKVLRNGQILIIRDNQTYTLQGQLIK